MRRCWWRLQRYVWKWLGGANFEVRSEDLREKIEEVMNENGKGKVMRKKAFEIKKMIEEATRDEEGFKGSSVAAMKDFLEAPLLIKNPSTNLPDNY